MRRGYLLPQGCKDLIDVLRLKEQQKFALSNLPAKLSPAKPDQKAIPLPAVKGELIIKTPTTVQVLADQLGQKPFKIIADLMAIGVFTSVSQVVAFETISIIARQYGFIARRAA